jgi:hypothetical protein
MNYGYPNTNQKQNDMGQIYLGQMIVGGSQSGTDAKVLEGVSAIIHITNTSAIAGTTSTTSTTTNSKTGTSGSSYFQYDPTLGKLVLVPGSSSTSTSTGTSSTLGNLQGAHFLYNSTTGHLTLIPGGSTSSSSLMGGTSGTNGAVQSAYFEYNPNTKTLKLRHHNGTSTTTTTNTNPTQSLLQGKYYLKLSMENPATSGTTNTGNMMMMHSGNMMNTGNMMNYGMNAGMNTGMMNSGGMNMMNNGGGSGTGQGPIIGYIIIDGGNSNYGYQNPYQGKFFSKPFFIGQRREHFRVNMCTYKSSYFISFLV